MTTAARTTPRPSVDIPLAAALVALIAFGVVMVYSASAVYADRLANVNNGYHYLVRQGLFAMMGLCVMFVCARVDVEKLRLMTYPILVVTVVLMAAVGLGFGKEVNGAVRWLPVGPINVQPSELSKLAMVLWLAYSLAKKRDRVESFAIGFLPHVLVAGLLMVLCLTQRDLGSAVMIGLLTFVVLFAAGARLGYLLGGLFLALPMLFFAVKMFPHRLARILGWLEPFKHRDGSGYQLVESFLAFGSGGLTGVGLGDSRQKLLFLPEAHTDFIGAIVGEELGLIGVWALALTFLFVFFRGMKAAWRAGDDYAGYLAVGLTMFIALQAFTNLAVVLGLLPTKGLALPFISYGGSSLLVNAAAAGIILSVSRVVTNEPSKRSGGRR